MKIRHIITLRKDFLDNLFLSPKNTIRLIAPLISILKFHKKQNFNAVSYHISKTLSGVFEILLILKN